MRARNVVNVTKASANLGPYLYRGVNHVIKTRIGRRMTRQDVVKIPHDDRL